MKISNLLIFSFLLTTILLLFMSCKDDNGDKPFTTIEGYDFWLGECQGENYILNEEETACVCPEGTHYRLIPIPESGREVTYCREILSGSFLYKADIKTCLYETRSDPQTIPGYENVYDAIGLAEFNFETEKVWLLLGNGGDGERVTIQIFGGGIVGAEQPGMTFHEDGSFSVVFYGLGNFEEDCLDWEERSEGCSAYYVTTKGRSNPERTKINLELTWQNCRDELLDKGTIEMWKEW